jgi:hypothetical protein
VEKDRPPTGFRRKASDLSKFTNKTELEEAWRVFSITLRFSDAQKIFPTESSTGLTAHENASEYSLHTIQKVFPRVLSTRLTYQNSQQLLVLEFPSLDDMHGAYEHCLNQVLARKWPQELRFNYLNASAKNGGLNNYEIPGRLVLEPIIAPNAAAASELVKVAVGKCLSAVMKTCQVPLEALIELPVHVRPHKRNNRPNAGATGPRPQAFVAFVICRASRFASEIIEHFDEHTHQTHPGPVRICGNGRLSLCYSCLGRGHKADSCHQLLIRVDKQDGVFTSKAIDDLVQNTGASKVTTDGARELIGHKSFAVLHFASAERQKTAMVTLKRLVDMRILKDDIYVGTKAPLGCKKCGAYNKRPDGATAAAHPEESCPLSIRQNFVRADRLDNALNTTRGSTSPKGSRLHSGNPWSTPAATGPSQSSSSAAITTSALGNTATGPSQGSSSAAITTSALGSNTTEQDPSPTKPAGTASTTTLAVSVDPLVTSAVTASTNILAVSAAPLVTSNPFALLAEEPSEPTSSVVINLEQSQLRQEEFPHVGFQLGMSGPGSSRGRMHRNHRGEVKKHPYPLHQRRNRAPGPAKGDFENKSQRKHKGSSSIKRNFSQVASQLIAGLNLNGGVTATQPPTTTATASIPVATTAIAPTLVTTTAIAPSPVTTTATAPSPVRENGAPTAQLPLTHALAQPPPVTQHQQKNENSMVDDHHMTVASDKTQPPRPGNGLDSGHYCASL